MTETSNTPDTVPRQPPRASRRRVTVAAGIVAALAIGGIGGAGASRLIHRWEPERVMLLQPEPIAQLKDDTVVAAKGTVAEIFGNKFILQDDSGRALIDTGPRGEDIRLADKGEAVTVQGRFDRGVLHAQLLVRPDGSTQAFGPPRPPRPPHPPIDGPEARRGPPPPPPPPGPDAPPAR